MSNHEAVTGFIEPPRTAGEAAYASLKRDILQCVLTPATEVREAELTARTGFGRTPVREALVKLAHEGLIEVRPRQSYRVADVTLTRVREIYELRMLLEPVAVESAVRQATSVQLTSLHDIAYAQEGQDPTGMDSFERDRHFRVELAACTNGMLAAVLRGLLEEMQRLFCSRPEEGVPAGVPAGERRVLYDAVRLGDVDVARTACIKQVDASRDRLVEAILRDLRGPELRAAHASLGAGVPRRPRSGPVHL